jgi:Tol biopolymer transport system component
MRQRPLLPSILIVSLAWLPACGERAAREIDFGPPENLGSVVNSPAFDGGPSISADGLTLYFTSERPGGLGGGDLWVTRRASTSEAFGPPENLGAGVNSSANEYAPSLSSDGLTLYFDSDRPGGPGKGDVWVATRSGAGEAFGSPRSLDAPVNSEAADGLPSISGDGLALYFCTRRSGGHGGMDLWVARRSSSSEPFRQAESLGDVVNGPSDDWGPGISSDELDLFFMSDREGGRGSQDLWVASRGSRSAPFGPPRNLGPIVNGPALDARPDVSADGAMLFFMSNRDGGSGQIDLWLSRRETRGRR